MATDSVGFDGTLYEADWAVAWPYMGHPSVVTDDAAQKVTVPGASLTVRVAVGAGAAAGVYVNNTSTVDIVLAAAVSTPKYWTICRRTDGAGVTGASSFLALGPTTTPVVAGTLQKSPGITYDSELAIYRVTPGSTVPVLEQDLRVTLAEAAHGWSNTWNPITKPGTILDDAAHGHTWAYRLSVPAGRVEIRGAIQAFDGAFTSSAVADIGSPLPVEARPSRPQYHMAVGTADSTHTGATRVSVGTDGQISFFNPYGPAWINFDGWTYDIA